MKLFVRLSAIIALLAINITGYAQQDPIEGIWYNEEKTSKIKIYKAKNDKFYGKVVWLKEPEKDGKERLDENNPDKSKRDNPIIGLVLLRSFEKDDDNEYDDGTIYDPRNGKTYSCVMTLNGDKLEVRGYVGVSWLGRTSEFTRAE